MDRSYNQLTGGLEDILSNNNIHMQSFPLLGLWALHKHCWRWRPQLKDKKETKNRGRPVGETPKELLQHIDKVPPRSLFSANTRQLQYHSLSLSDQLSCPVCAAVLHQPVQMSCGAIVCFHCCSTWVRHCTSARLSVSCPCCYDHQLDSTSVHPPPSLILSLLSGMLICCERNCGSQVRADQYDRHLQGKCRSHYQCLVHSPSKMTLKNILSTPATQPATPAEMKCTEHLMKILDTSNNQVLRLPTYGQVSNTPPY